MNQPPQTPYGPPPQQGPGWPQWQGPPQQGWAPPPPQPQQWRPGPGQQGWRDPNQQGWHQQPQRGPQNNGALPGAGLGTHLKRAVDWNVADVIVAPRERAALSAAGVEERLQGQFAWRRSSLLVALPFLVLSVILAFVNIADQGTDGYTDFGVFLQWLPPIALLLVPIAALRVIVGWTELRVTSRVLIITWLISIVVPMATAVMPFSWVVDEDFFRNGLTANGAPTSVEGTLQGLRVIQAVSYALVLLPVVLSVPGGVLKGAARVKSMFPSTSLTGWFLVAVAPFYSMFMIVVFVLLDQIVGNGVLLVGVALIAFSPWLFVIYRKVYATPLSLAEAKTELARASRLGGVVLLAGIFFIVIFLLTAKVGSQDVLGGDSDKSVFTYVDVLKTLAEVLSRSIVTTVVFSVIFLQMVFSEFTATRGMREDIKQEHERELRALERYVSVQKEQTGVYPIWRPEDMHRRP